MSLLSRPLERQDGAAASQPPRTYLFMPATWQRRKVLKWLKRTHAWLGLWGALVTFFFSFTGIVLNHRTILPVKLAAGKTERHVMVLPAPPPADAAAMADWLETRFDVGRAQRRVQVAAAKPTPWGEGRVMQPETWRINFGTPDQIYTANYWVGDAKVEVVDYKPNFFMVLNGLHRANGGVGAIWVLITDAVAVGLIVLSMTGVLLWTRLHGRRLLAVGIGVTAPLVSVAAYLALL